MNLRDVIPTPVPYECTCRALELGPKAYLLCKDVPIKTLRRKKCGHELNALLVLARAHGIGAFWNPSDAELEQIRIAKECYEDKGFEYVQVIRAVNGYSDLPDLDILKGTTTN